MTEIAASSARKKVGSFQKRMVSFFCNRLGGECLTVNVAVDSKCSPYQQFNFISLFLYLELIFARGKG